MSLNGMFGTSFPVLQHNTLLRRIDNKEGFKHSVYAGMGYQKSLPQVH